MLYLQAKAPTVDVHQGGKVHDPYRPGKEQGVPDMHFPNKG